MRRLARLLLVLVVPFGVACFAGPFLMLFGQDGGGMIDDTRAYFGAGTSDGVPVVSEVRCLQQRYGSNSSRGFGGSDWGCTLYLAPAVEAPRDDPFATLPYDEAMAEYNRRLLATMAALRDGETMSGKIERVLATNRNGDLPRLRRLSGEGEPARFGAVWSGWEIAGRWLKWLLFSSLLVGFGIFCLLGARAIWRRSA